MSKDINKILKVKIGKWSMTFGEFECKDKIMIYLGLPFLFLRASSCMANMVRIRLHVSHVDISWSHNDHHDHFHHSWWKSDFKLQSQIYKFLGCRYICVTKTVQNVESKWITIVYCEHGITKFSQTVKNPKALKCS